MSMCPGVRDKWGGRHSSPSRFESAARRLNVSDCSGYRSGVSRRGRCAGGKRGDVYEKRTENADKRNGKDTVKW